MGVAELERAWVQAERKPGRGLQALGRFREGAFFYL